MGVMLNAKDGTGGIPEQYKRMDARRETPLVAPCIHHAATTPPPRPRCGKYPHLFSRQTYRQHHVNGSTSGEPGIRNAREKNGELS